jgi:hypothetical protein
MVVRFKFLQGFSLKQKKVNKISLANEKGATLIEASVVLPLFIMFILGIVLICSQLFASYKTYYANFQTLKTISTGPIRNPSGKITKDVEVRFKEVLAANLRKYNTGVVLGTDIILIRIQIGDPALNPPVCYKVKTNTSTGVVIEAYQDNAYDCPRNNTPTIKILPRSWVTLETYIKPVGLKFKKIPIPTMKIISTVKMYDWELPAKVATP